MLYIHFRSILKVELQDKSLLIKHEGCRYVKTNYRNVHLLSTSVIFSCGVQCVYRFKVQENAAPQESKLGRKAVF